MGVCSRPGTKHRCSCPTQATSTVHTLPYAVLSHYSLERRDRKQWGRPWGQYGSSKVVWIMPPAYSSTCVAPCEAPGRIFLVPRGCGMACSIIDAATKPPCVASRRWFQKFTLQSPVSKSCCTLKWYSWIRDYSLLCRIIDMNVQCCKYNSENAKSLKIFRKIELWRFTVVFKLSLGEALNTLLNKFVQWDKYVIRIKYLGNSVCSFRICLFNESGQHCSDSKNWATLRIYKELKSSN